MTCGIVNDEKLTSSNFGRIMLWKVAVNEKFINSLLKDRKFTSASTKYGKNNEMFQETCIGKRQKIMYMNVACYLIKPFPFIAATPDGKICANGQSG